MVEVFLLVMLVVVVVKTVLPEKEEKQGYWTRREDWTNLDG
jgi:hypothetical protein